MAITKCAALLAAFAGASIFSAKQQLLPQPLKPALSLQDANAPNRNLEVAHDGDENDGGKESQAHTGMQLALPLQDTTALNINNFHADLDVAHSDGNSDRHQSIAQADATRRGNLHAVLAKAGNLRRSLKPEGVAICVSGNLRIGHDKEFARKWITSLRNWSPTGDIFAYVNLCDSPQKWTEVALGHPPRRATCRLEQDSYFASTVKPLRLLYYDQSDVAAPSSCNSTANVSAWYPGVFEQWMGVKRCFQMVQAEEAIRGREYEYVVRSRPDKLLPAYCDVSAFSGHHSDKIHAHPLDGPVDISAAHDAGYNYIDDFWAISPRKVADIFFSTVDSYGSCLDHWGYAPFGRRNITGVVKGYPGEVVVSSHLWRNGIKTVDLCPGHSCRCEKT